MCLSFPAGKVVMSELTSSKASGWPVIWTSVPNIPIISYHSSGNGRKKKPQWALGFHHLIPPLSVQDSHDRIMRKRIKRKGKKKKEKALEINPPPCPLEELFNRNNCQIISCHHPLHCPLHCLAESCCPQSILAVCMDLPDPAWSHPSWGAQNSLSVPLDICRSPLCPQHFPGWGLALESRADTAPAKCEPAENAAAGHIVFRAGSGRIKTKCVIWAGWNELQMKLELGLLSREQGMGLLGFNKVWPVL